MATAAVHSADEAAQRILPAAAPLAVDPVQDVRHTALACVQTFAQILADHNRTLDDALLAAGASVPSMHRILADQGQMLVAIHALHLSKAKIKQPPGVWAGRPLIVGI